MSTVPLPSATLRPLFASYSVLIYSFGLYLPMA